MLAVETSAPPSSTSPLGPSSGSAESRDESFDFKLPHYQRHDRQLLAGLVHPPPPSFKEQQAPGEIALMPRSSIPFCGKASGDMMNYLSIYIMMVYLYIGEWQQPGLGVTGGGLGWLSEGAGGGERW